MLENVTIRVDTGGVDGTFGLLLGFASGQVQHLSSHTESERDAWVAAIQSTKHTIMRKHIQSLQNRLQQLQTTLEPCEKVNVPREPCDSVVSPDSVPLLESALGCDNLLCDSLGRSPSTRLLIFTRNSSKAEWQLYNRTEVVEV